MFAAINLSVTRKNKNQAGVDVGNVVWPSRPWMESRRAISFDSWDFSEVLVNTVQYCPAVA